MTSHLTDTCPVEIWALIFSYSCTDGGQTGRSLSACCKFAREVSHPFKYQSLAVNGRDAPALAEAIRQGYWDVRTQHCWDLLIYWDDRDANLAREYLQEDFSAIMLATHSSLRSLVLFAPAFYLIPLFDAQSITFPHLNYLSLFCSSPYVFFSLSSQLRQPEDLENANAVSIPPAWEHTADKSSAVFPSLTRVRFRFKYGIGNPRLFKCLAWSAPELRSLQINQMAFHGTDTLRANLASSFGMLFSGEGSATTEPLRNDSEEAPRRVSPHVILELMHEPKHPIQQLAWNAEYAWLTALQRQNTMFKVVTKGLVPQHEGVVSEWVNGYWT